MKNTLFVAIITSCFLFCKKAPIQLEKIEAEQLKTDSTIVEEDRIVDFIAPYSKHLNEQLDAPLSYVTKTLTKNDGVLESSLGNLMADIAMEQARPIIKQRYNISVDFVLLNHGGIRAPIPKGTITARNAFEVMPFENELVLVTLTGEKTEALLTYLAEEHRPHPIANLNLIIEKPEDDEDSYEIEDAIINGKAFNDKTTYHVLTTDYLQQGGDNMVFFDAPVALYKSDYKLRNAMIDYFKKTDTITPILDNRFRYDN